MASAPVVARLEVLDLSMGTLSDDGATALLSGQPLTHLKMRSAAALTAGGRVSGRPGRRRGIHLTVPVRPALQPAAWQGPSP
ncbi:hypothetical protein GCM10023195_00170 [Actinoallomurus liliacearum]|uniref:Uncharacterized protein n=1 Tax=Actinoallomurus liliacearum TaxID=1080073 RepID=A0ABP8TA83_9ACTN